MTKYVVVAGSFQKFHKGHQVLLNAADKRGLPIIVGITSDDYVSKHKKFFIPFDIRKSRVEGYLKSLNATFTTIELKDEFGDVLTNPDYAEIVVSPETAPAVEEINKQRLNNSLNALNIIIVPHVLDSFGKPISSTRIYNGEINQVGEPINRTKVKFLGTCGGISSPERCSPAIMISHGKERILLDCGADTSRQLLIVGMNVDEISAIYITHAHVDHFIGLPLLVMHHFMMLGRTKPLKIYIPENANKFIVPFIEEYDLKSPYPIEIINFSENETYGGRLKVTPFKVTHSIAPAYGFKIDDIHGNRIVYTGDCVSDGIVAKEAKNADLLIHEANYSDEDGARYGHSQVTQAIKAAKEANVETLCLTHISMKYMSDCSDYISKENMKEIGSMKFEVAYDFKEIVL